MNVCHAAGRSRATTSMTCAANSAIMACILRHLVFSDVRSLSSSRSSSTELTPSSAPRTQPDIDASTGFPEEPSPRTGGEEAARRPLNNSVISLYMYKHVHSSRLALCSAGMDPPSIADPLASFTTYDSLRLSDVGCRVSNYGVLSKLMHIGACI